jgi:hypothetical protein
VHLISLGKSGIFIKESVIKNIKIENSYGISENVSADQIGENEYKLLENPVFSCKINYGTIVKAFPIENGELVLTGILKVSEYTTRKFLLSYNAKDSDFVTKLEIRCLQLAGPG